MRQFLLSVVLGSVFLLIQGCGPTRRFGNTIERDEDNPCFINMVIQVAVEGTDEDVAAVKKDLEECFKNPCYIPCSPDSTKGCRVNILTDVRKFSTLSEDVAAGFHYVYMVDDDSLPSNAYIGRANNGISSGTWRRNQPRGVYCHETLHFLGLEDKYCDRIYDPILDSIIVKRTCDPPPEPNGVCCIPSNEHKRCTYPCEGHETDLMGASGTYLSCENIRDVLKIAGYNSCPPECCNSDRAFTMPLPQYYFNFNYDKISGSLTPGGIGITGGYTYKLTPNTGVTGEGGYTTHTEKGNNYKQTNSRIDVLGGISWIPKIFRGGSRFCITTQLLGGISVFRQKTTSGNSSFRDSQLGPKIKLGAGFDWILNRMINIRVFQAGYGISLIDKDLEKNYNVGAGIVLKLTR